MARTRKIADRSKVAEQMSMQMMLMGYGDYKSMLGQELSCRIWKRKNKLSRKKIRRLQYLLYVSDSPSLLSFTVALGRLIWSDNLKAKRRKFERKLSEKIKQWSVKKRKRRGKPGKLRAIRRLYMERKWKGRNGNVGAVGKIVTGFHMRPVLGSRSRMVVRRKMKRQYVKVGSRSLMYRLAMAMKFLSIRNLYVNSDWEFWTIWFVHQVFGFWGSIAFGESLSYTLKSFAKKFGIPVVSSQHLERLESGFGCSSSRRCIGCRLDI